MNKNVVDNPYNAPNESSPIAGKSSDSIPWGVVILHAGFLGFNLLMLFFSVELLKILEEFGIDLPGLSTFVYRFAIVWYGVGGVLVWYAFFSVFIHFKLKAKSPPRATFFTSLVMLVWLLFTAVLFLGLFLPFVLHNKSRRR